MSEHAHHQHSHHDRTSKSDRGASRRSLLITMVLTASIMLMEGIGGWVSGSLALLSDAGHMLTDLSALGIAYLACLITDRPADTRRTFGYWRLEILSALTNGILLGILAIGIVWEAVQRLSNPTPIQVPVVLGVGTVGLIVNILGMFLLGRFKTQLSVKGAYLHIVGDLIGSIGVIVGTVVIALTGWTIIDPIISIGIALIIVFSGARLVRECVDILLETIPIGIEIDHVIEAILAVEGVTGAHDVHIWSITSGMHTFSCHLDVQHELSQHQRDAILTEVKTVLSERFGLDHSTIQIEGEQWQEVGHIH